MATLCFIVHVGDPGSPGFRIYGRGASRAGALASAVLARQRHGLEVPKGARVALWRDAGLAMPEPPAAPATAEQVVAALGRAARKEIVIDRRGAKP